MTRDHLLDAAIRKFHQKGYRDTRISDIVSEAGVAQGTFYLYFKSKEEIFMDICINHMNRFHKVFEETETLFGGKDLNDIKQNLYHFLKKLLEVYKENIHISELLFREGVGHNGLYKEITQRFFFKFIKLIREHIEQDVFPSQFRLENSEILSVFLVGMFERTAFYFMLMKKQLDTKILAEQMANFMINGSELNYTH